MVNKEKEELYFKNTSQNKLRIGVTNRAFPKKCVTIIQIVEVLTRNLGKAQIFI